METGIDTGAAMLTLQTVHTLIYVAGQASVLLMLWCGFTGRQHDLLKFAMICLSVILVARAANGGLCPLYTMAIWLANAGPGEPVKDMLTPLWFNEIVTPINIPLGALGLCLVAWRTFAHRWQPSDDGHVMPFLRSPTDRGSPDRSSASGVDRTER